MESLFYRQITLLTLILVAIISISAESIPGTEQIL